MYMTDVCFSVNRIQAVSFQKVPLTFSLLEMDDASQGVFSINPTTGDLRLLQPRRHVSDPQQYRMMVKAQEQYTNFESVTEVS